MCVIPRVISGSSALFLLLNSLIEHTSSNFDVQIPLDGGGGGAGGAAGAAGCDSGAGACWRCQAGCTRCR